jgi:enamine deaminase RidA (YjgF/YER057c/UK114 family)
LENITKGTQIFTLKRGSCEEFFITVKLDQGEPAQSLFDRAARAVEKADARIISQDVFGLKDGKGNGSRFLKKAFGEIQWPVTWVEDRTQEGIPGIYVWAIAGISVEPLAYAGRIIGSLFEDEHARYCRLGGLLPENPSCPNVEQAQNIFDQMIEILGTAGMDFSRVFRTWYFNRDILSWYADFNRVRNAFFTHHGVFDGLVPASTGMAGGNPAGVALQGGLLALDPRGSGARMDPIPSPLQCPALEYGSSFSRAVEVITGDIQRVFISGTASIDRHGETIFKSDVEKQIEFTLEVVEAILRSRGMSYSKTTRGVAYFKHRDDARRLTKYCDAFGLDPASVLIGFNDICRDDLLFEIEIDAVRRIPG